MASGHCQTPSPAASLELLFALVLDANTPAHPKATEALGRSPVKLFLFSLDEMFLSAPSQRDEEGETKMV